MKPILLLTAAALLLAQAPPNSLGVTAGHHHMTVTDPAAQARIWSEVFGAPATSGTAGVSLKLPGISLVFSKGNPSGGTEGSAVDHFAFGVKDLDGTRDKLKAAGVEIVREVAGAQREIVTMFPDKIKVEFYADPALATPLAHHHIHFSTVDVEALREWYVKVFGAEVTRNGTAVSTRLPGTALSFRKVDQATPPTKGRALDHIGFDVANVEAFCRQAATMMVTCERSAAASKTAFMMDPAGTRIEISTR